MSPLEPSSLVDGDAVHAFAARAFGKDPADERGVLHTAAVWEGPNGPRVLRIGEHAPKSPTDFFLLHLARARADFVVTTGKILRDEPALTYDLGVGAGFADALLDYRRRYVGTAARGKVAVLTRGDLDLGHRALHGWAEAWLFVPATAPSDLDERAAMHGLRVVRFPELGLDQALDAIRQDGARTISIEAGITTTAERYTRGVGFDELVLTRYLEPSIDCRAIGGRFPERATLERILGPARTTFEVREPSGLWVVDRFRGGST